MTCISIFGSTGSIGKNTVKLIEAQGGADAYTVEVLTGHSNVELLARQARKLRAKRVVVGDQSGFPIASALLSGTNTEVLVGPQALLDAARVPTDWSMSCIVGAAGLAPTVELAQSTSVLALANKESLVCAGPFLKSVCARNGTLLLPVDSEHSAIFQAIGAAPGQTVERIILTASGGPFRTWSGEQIAGATLKDALNHPNWDMGKRITIDSASMFNKALEVIEAQQLFNVTPDQIEVVVHPQSIVHSMVGFTDGAILAQLGPPDMCGPIGYALNYPDRRDLPVERLDFGALGSLDFEAPDLVKFPSIQLAYDAMSMGGAAGAVLNAAKEAALDLFLNEKIAFPQMADCVAQALEEFSEDASAVLPGDGLNPILELDAKVRDHVLAQIPRQMTQKGKRTG